MGCCNGLVCILLKNNRQFTKKSKKLPDIQNMPSGGISTYGLGYDESSGDYKVVAMSRCGDSTIYSVKIDSWKSTVKAGKVVYVGNLVSEKLQPSMGVF